MKPKTLVTLLGLAAILVGWGITWANQNAKIVANALNQVIEKDPNGVFVSITRTEAFFWGGVPRDDAAIFDIRWIGIFSVEQKSEITNRIIKEIAPATGLEPSRMRVIFTSKSSEDWGRVSQ